LKRKFVTGFSWDPKTKVAKIDLFVPGTGGTVRKRRTLHADSKDDALEVWRRLRAATQSGTSSDNRPWTLKRYVAEIWPKLQARVAPSTAEMQEDALTRYVLPAFAERKLETIRRPDLEDLVAFLKTEKHLAPSTINRTLSLVRRILRDAEARELIAVYPVRGGLPREKETPLRLELSDEEMARFLAVFDDERGFRRALAERTANRNVARIGQANENGPTPPLRGGGRRGDSETAGKDFARFRASKPAFVIALETGLRRGDLIGLSWENVDLQQGFLRLVMQKTRDEVEIPISKRCREALLECRKRRSLKSPQVLSTEKGLPYSVPTLSRYYATAKALAGITRRLRLHDLRHTFASRLASCGVGLQIIAKALGHRSTRMTERYARPSREASMRAIVEALDRPSIDTSIDTRAVSGGLSVVPPEGFEPSISTLKGWRPGPLDDGGTRGTADSSGFSP
jgi:integrase